MSDVGVDGVGKERHDRRPVVKCMVTDAKALPLARCFRANRGRRKKEFDNKFKENI